jgi:hypothetical protein
VDFSNTIDFIEVLGAGRQQNTTPSLFDFLEFFEETSFI